MPDWTSIPNSALAVGAPPRAADAVALRDNPIALARGAPDAPRISPWAVRTIVAAGDTVRYADMLRVGLARRMGTGFLVNKNVTILSSGTIRVKYRTYRPVVASGSATLVTQAAHTRGTTVTNLGQVNHANSSGSATINRSIASVDVLPGDSISIQGRFGSSDFIDAVAAFDNFTIETSGGYLWAIGGGSMVLAAEPA